MRHDPQQHENATSYVSAAFFVRNAAFTAEANVRIGIVLWFLAAFVWGFNIGLFFRALPGL